MPPRLLRSAAICPPELGSVEHRGVRAFTAGNGDVGGVTEKRDA